jgi:hypothetical protein
VLSAILGEGAGETVGMMLEPHIGMFPAQMVAQGITGAVVGGKMMVSSRLASFNAKVEAIQRQMLTDPGFARKLLTDYKPQLPSKAGSAALDYVKNRLSGYIAPQIDRNIPQQTQ